MKKILFESLNIDLNLKSEPLKSWEAAKKERETKKKKHAMVLTPIWIIEKMVNTLLEQNGTTPEEFIYKTVLDPAIGEGHFITTRYDPYTGEPIPFENRVGVLDVKLKACTTYDEAFAALSSCYGCDIQEECVYLARENILMTWKEWCKRNGYFDLFETYMITRNIKQIDFLKGTNPKTGESAFFETKQGRIELKKINEKSKKERKK